MFAGHGRFHRSMTRPFFSRDRISDFEIFAKHADQALNRIERYAGSPFDFQDLVSRFTLDSATEFLFGSCVHSLRSEAPPPFGLAFSRVQHQLAQRSRAAPLWPLFELFRDKTRFEDRCYPNFSFITQVFCHSL